MKKRVFKVALFGVIALSAMSCTRENYYHNYEWQNPIQYFNPETDGVLSGDVLVSKDGTVLLKWQNPYTKSLDMESHPTLKNIKIIETEAFLGSNITNIVLPKQLERIEQHAFLNSKLTSVNIPDTVIYIGEGAFYNSPLERVKLSGNVKELKNNIFGNTKIASIEIPEGVEILNGSVVSGTIEAVILPSTLKEMASGAFSPHSGYSIKKMVVNATTPPKTHSDQYGNYSPIFSTYGEDYEIRVPAESLEAYKTAPSWNKHSNFIFAQE